MERNNHHVWHERKWYKSRLDKRFRSYGGFVINMAIPDHQELHAHVRPPIKPAPWLMEVVLEHLRVEEVPIEETIPATIDLLEFQAQRTILVGESTLMRKINNNLIAQYEFIAPAIADNLLYIAQKST